MLAQETPQMTDIYTRIKKDHHRHRALLAAISNSQGNFDDRRKLWDEFYYDVKAHAAAEEETFYSQLMSDEDGQDPARHSVAEHKELDDIMDELEEMDIESPGWLNRFTTLKDEYEHHMDEEENEIFAKGLEIFSDEQAKEFAGQFETRKKAELKLVDEKAEEKLED